MSMGTSPDASATASWRSSAETKVVEPRAVRRCDVQKVEAPRQQRGRVILRQRARRPEHLLQIQGDLEQPARRDVLTKLRMNGTALMPGHYVPSNEQLESIRHFEAVQRREGHLPDGSHDGSSGSREGLGDVERDDGAGVDVRRHRCPRLSMTVAEPSLERSRSPNT